MFERSPVLDVTQEFVAATSCQVREELAGYLERDLLGPWDGPSEYLGRPSRLPRDRYLIGMLGPKFTPRLTVDAAEEVPDAALAGDADGDDGELPEEFTVQSAGRIWASSMGLAFTVPDDVAAVAATAAWGHYEPVVPADGGERALWTRHPVEHRLEVRLDRGLSQRIPLANPGPRDMAAEDERSVGNAEGRDGAGVFLAVEVREHSVVDRPGTRIVQLTLINDQAEPPANRDAAWLFQATLQVKAMDGATDVFLPVDDPLEDLKEHQRDQEDQHLRVLYRNHLSYAIGRNIAVHADLHAESRQAWRLTTTWLPSFDVPATIAPPTDATPHLDGLNLSMDTLATLPPNELATALAPLADGYTAWLAERTAQVSDLPESLRAAAHRALYHARDVAARIGAGVTLLLDDEQTLDAFRFANQAMAMQRRHTAIAGLRDAEGVGYVEAEERIDAQGAQAASWRPFQLAFILLNLPALTNPTHPERRTGGGAALVDLLFFPTGGGKTEAYLGLAAYTFAIRRLQGVLGSGADARDGGDGVAVLMRYTLRLLTAQQFQRAAALVCAAEVLRREADDGRWGAVPFRIGLWVGSLVAPNWYTEAARQVEDARTAGSGQRANVLQTLVCPWCGERLSAIRDLREDRDQRRILLYCPRGEGALACPFSQRMAPDDGLPILTVDEELYRYTPSLIVATVDKLAQLPWFGFAGTLFGRVSKRCPRHGYRHPDLDPRTGCGDRHRSNARLPAVTSAPVRRLRPPDLIIQDELHLISGALGTTVGLFEGAVDELCTWPAPDDAGGVVPAGPVIVASTATTKRADAQVLQLYGRRLSVFPPQALDVADTFFSRQIPVTPSTPGRRYLGVCAHGIRLKAAEIRLAEILLLAGQTLFDQYGSPADPYMTMVGYFNATRELAGMRRLLDDQLTNRLRRDSGRDGISRRIASRTGLLNINELTSRISSGDIAAVLKRLEYAFDEELDTTARRKAIGAEVRDKGRKAVLPPRAGEAPVDVVLATSMLQVGVDVTRFGLMVVTGQPKNTAEYIQASSRVGRDPDRPGLVVTIYNWTRPRDLAHFEDFEPYHATFYRQVESLSVTPYTRRALDRGTAALLVAAVRHATEEYSANAGAGSIDLGGPVVTAIMDRLLRRAEAAGGDRARGYLAERLRAVRDAWISRRGGDYPLGYVTKREESQTLTALLDGAGEGPWSELTVARSMRDTENEVNLLVPGSNLGEQVISAPPWIFTPHEEASHGDAEPEDKDDGHDESDEAGPGGGRR